MRKRWKANKLPVVGCPECISAGEVFIHERGESEKCDYCKGKGTIPTHFNRAKESSSINEELKGIEDGNRNKCEVSH